MHSFFTLNKDAKYIIIWVDNCAAKNKNWTLFSYLVWLVNSKEIEADRIELNYREAGHTFISADIFHHQVAKQLKQKGKVYDFDDFSDAVQNSYSGKVIYVMLSRLEMYSQLNCEFINKLPKTK